MIYYSTALGAGSSAPSWHEERCEYRLAGCRTVYSAINPLAGGGDRSAHDVERACVTTQQSAPNTCC